MRIDRNNITPLVISINVQNLLCEDFYFQHSSSINDNSFIDIPAKEISIIVNNREAVYWGTKQYIRCVPKTVESIKDYISPALIWSENDCNVICATEKRELYITGGVAVDKNGNRIDISK